MISRDSVIFALRLFLLVAIVLAGAGCKALEVTADLDRCVISGRPVHPETRVRLAIENGKKSGFSCCLRCAMTYARQTGMRVVVYSVADYETHALSVPEKLVYLTASDVAPCVHGECEISPGRRECLIKKWDRCAPSSLAFRTEAAARAFQSRHGGTIETFGQLIAGTMVSPANSGQPGT